MAVEAELGRLVKREPIATSWPTFVGVDAAIRSVDRFTNVPTVFLALPTHSSWTVLWNNSFLCDGYDSLCWCLTKHHGLDTIHWTAHDGTTTFQPGASFAYRRLRDGELLERSVYVGREDRRWMFFESGSRLPEEDGEAYLARLKRHRLNEHRMVDLLGRLEAYPWQDSFYDTGGAKKYFRLARTSYPPTIIETERDTVLARQDPF